MKVVSESPALDHHHDSNLHQTLEASNILKSKRITADFYADLINIKKERAEKDREQAAMFYFLGLAISLLLVIIAINWKSYDRSGLLDLGEVNTDFDDLLEIPISEQPPPPPPENKLITQEIVEVKNEELIEEIKFDLDIEITEETSIEEIDMSFLDKQDEEKVDEIFSIVENWPEPEGGLSAFYNYISNNIKYPPAARRLNIQGLVFLRFVVEKDGSISDVQVVKGIGAGCDEEAHRVLTSAPSWKPGKQRGRPVRVFMTVPIRFVLAD